MVINQLDFKSIAWLDCLAFRELYFSLGVFARFKMCLANSSYKNPIKSSFDINLKRCYNVY